MIEKAKKNQAGYVLVKLTPDDWLYEHTPYSFNKGFSGWMYAQRYVMAEFLGRPLDENDKVLFKNGDKTDIRLVNLELRYGKHKLPKCHGCLILKHL